MVFLTGKSDSVKISLQDTLRIMLVDLPCLLQKRLVQGRPCHCAKLPEWTHPSSPPPIVVASLELQSLPFVLAVWYIVVSAKLAQDGVELLAIRLGRRPYEPYRFGFE